MPLPQESIESHSVLDDLVHAWMTSDPSGVLPLLGAGAAIVGTMGLGWWFSTLGGQKLEPLFDIDNQTIQENDGSRHSAYVENGKHMSVMFDGCTTIYESIRRGLRESRDGLALGRRVVNDDGSLGEYTWITYSDVIEKSIHLAAGFLKLGLTTKDKCVGVYSKNRPEWIIAEHACYTYKMAIVPLYDTLGPEACTYIINQTELKLIVIDTIDKANALLKQRPLTDLLQWLVVMERPTAQLIEDGRRAAVDVRFFDDVVQLGADDARRPPPTPPSPGDLATICYTSGTTGTPKGVMLTHGNVIADGTTLAYFKHAALSADDVMISFLPLAHMFERILEICYTSGTTGAVMLTHGNVIADGTTLAYFKHAALSTDDVVISFLPLAHMFERILEVVAFQCGGKVGYSSGDIRKLAEDIKELRPTVVPVVPRVLNRIYDKVFQEASKSSVKKMLFHWALSSKTSDLNQSVIRQNSVWDRLVFGKIRDGMGGRVRLMICGSAPLSANVLTFIRAALGCVVVEGYGQTECVAAACITLEGDHTPGHVGVPSPCCSVRLEDVPELGYYSANNQGEVCVKGTNVFTGYFREPEKTLEVLGADGWLHTGDIGEWTPAGTLKIVDRKKHIFKLSQGEYVAPEKIENVYLRSKYIAQVFVFGESLRSALVAIVVPDPLVLPKEAQKLSKDTTLSEHTPMEVLCRNEAITAAILDDMTKVGKQAGLHTFEQVKAIHLHGELFSVENGLLTPTLKTKRPDLKTFFKEELDRIYATLDCCIDKRF